jgi:hypothetical protein
MKIRTGFVSNSSSSSFCIYGVCLTEDDFKSFMQKIKEEFKDERDSYEAIDSYVYEKKLGLETHSIEGYSFYVGKSIQEMNDSETKKQFMDRTINELSDLFGKSINCSWIEEAWYNG